MLLFLRMLRGEAIMPCGRGSVIDHFNLKTFCTIVWASWADDVKEKSEQATIAIQARPCLGPCGDGPNVVVYHPETKRRVRAAQPRPARPPKSFLPEPVPGIYQVRTQSDVD